VGVNLVGLVLICGGAIYAAFTDSRWWVPFAVLAIIPVVTIVDFLQQRLDAETVMKRQTALLDRIGHAPSPSVELIQIIEGDLERAGLDVRQGGLANSFTVETPTGQLRVEVVGLPGND